MEKRPRNYWETLSPEADAEVERLMLLFQSGKINPLPLFREVVALPAKFNDCDMCKETTNKIFDFMNECEGIENEPIYVAAYHKAQEEYFEKYIK